MGSLGFMTPFDAAELEPRLDTIIKGGFNLTLRSRLRCRVVRLEERLLMHARAHGVPAGDLDEEDLPPIPSLEQLEAPLRETQETGWFCALNEIAVSRGSQSLIDVDVYADRLQVTKVLADGLVLATPTGSTAYSMSAGGSMVHPAVPCTLFTPICPHSLSARPMLFPDSAAITIEVPPTARSSAVASFDGKTPVELYHGDALVVKVSPFPLPAVCKDSENDDWFEVVTGVLQWNQRAAFQKPLSKTKET